MAGKEKKYDIVAALDLCADILLKIGEVVPQFGQKEHMIDDLNIEMGGSCSIFSCQAAKLGLSVLGIGTVGDDVLGSMITDRLAKSGVITECIKVDPSIKTGATTILCKDNGDRSMLTYSGGIDEITYDRFTPEIIGNARHLHIGSYYLTKKLKPQYPVLAERMKSQTSTVSLDTNWDPEENWHDGLWELLKHVDIFMPNENEILAISGKKTLDAAIDAILEYVPVIAVKSGEKGASVFTGSYSHHEPAMKVEAIDAVGAGDSFDAGFIYGFLSGFSLDKCLKAGVICGSLNVTKAGGLEGQPNLKELLKYLDGGES